MNNKNSALWLLAILLVTTLIYLNHFDNAFQFDDSHAIVNNIYIRDLKNIPAFFTDAKYMTTLLSAQYRPITTSITAVEYWLAGGLNPVAFHLVAFIFFLLQLITMYFFYTRIFARTSGESTSAHSALSLAAVAIFALHPAIAETVNYLIQQADLLSTFFVVLSFVLYFSAHQKRDWGIYLIPVVLSTLSKPLGFMSAPLFAAFHFIEAHSGKPLSVLSVTKNAGLALKKSLPVWILCIAMGALHVKLTPQAYDPGGFSSYYYAITQPYVLLSYVGALFCPIDLSADTDWALVTKLSDYRFIVGILFLLASVGGFLWALRSTRRLPISFGIAWFFITLLPTSSIVPLAEVKNDHRMFFPFVGLLMAVVWTAYLFLGEKFQAASNTTRRAVQVAFAMLLTVFAYSTYQRNEIWDTPKTLWYDVTQKSPRNGRGLMNYGLNLMSAGDYNGARDYFERARQFTPNYFTLHINLGIVYGALKDYGRADTNFLRAIELAPGISEPKLFYARYLLNERGDVAKAKELYDKLPRNTELSADMRHLGLEIYARANDQAGLKALIDDTLSISPQEPLTLLYKDILDSTEGVMIRDLDLAIASISAQTAGDFINLSLKAYTRGNMDLALELAESALEKEPNNAAAMNNKAAALMGLEMWVEAKEACEKALVLDPSLTIAKNNLAYITSRLNTKTKKH